jgi:hypothetical protein
MSLPNRTTLEALTALKMLVTDSLLGSNAAWNCKWVSAFRRNVTASIFSIPLSVLPNTAGRISAESDSEQDTFQVASYYFMFRRGQ